MDINFILRLLTLVLLIIWRVYWFLTAKKAMLNKPKTDTTKRMIESMMIIFLGTYVVINLVGFIIFPFNNFFIQIIGFVLVLLGFSQAIAARKKLADNWTEA